MVLLVDPYIGRGTLVTLSARKVSNVPDSADNTNRLQIGAMQYMSSCYWRLVWRCWCPSRRLGCHAAVKRLCRRTSTGTRESTLIGRERESCYIIWSRSALTCSDTRRAEAVSLS